MEVPWLTPPKKFKRVYSAEKVMALIFKDSQGVIMIDFLEQGRTINGALRRIEEATPGNHKKEARKTDLCVLLLDDNAPAHMSQVAMTAGTECGFEILPHPTYSPDMSPSD